MKNNATLIDEIFSSIDEMDSITMESSLEVMNSILDSYDKALTIMENYEGDDIDAFSMIYQEGEIMDEVRAKSKDSNMFVNIIAFIPRLLIAIFHAIQKAWNGGKSTKDAATAAEKFKSWASNAKDFLSKVIDLEVDERGKIIGATVAGISVTAVTGFILAKKGIFKKISNSFKTFWDARVKALRDIFKKEMTPEDVPERMEDVGKLSYDKPADAWSTHFNLNAVIEYVTASKELITDIGKITEITPSSEKTIKACHSKLSHILKISLVSKGKQTYTTEQMVKFFKDVNAAMNGLYESGTSTWEKCNEIAKMAKEKQDDDSRKDKKVLGQYSHLTDALGKYVGTLPNLTTFITTFSTEYEHLLDLAEKCEKENAAAVANGESNASETTSSETTEKSNEGSASEKKAETTEKPKEESTNDEGTENNSGETTTESFDTNLDDDEDVITESVSSRWYSR